MEAHDEGTARAMAEANEVFEKLAETVQAAVSESPDRPLDVLEIARNVELEIDDLELRHHEIPRLIYPLRFCAWYDWFPWRPLWCYWWHRRYPYYECCHWWWFRCHPWYR